MKHTRPLIGISARAAVSADKRPRPLYGVKQTYVQAVFEAGGVPVLLPPVFGEPTAEILLEQLDGLLLSGGGDLSSEWYGQNPNSLLEQVDPERDRMELALARIARTTGKPLLAVCRGMQILNVTYGGSLFIDITTQLPGTLLHRPADGQPLDTSNHPVQLAPDSRIATILDQTSVTVNSFHHQAVENIGEGLIPTAFAPDKIIEGIEDPNHPFCVGVQWHPEEMLGGSQGMERLFLALIQASQK